MARYLYSDIAHTIATVKRLDDTASTEQHETTLSMWEEWLNSLEQLLPSGSGIDNGTTIDRERSHAEKIVLHFGFHHMNDGGYYDGWTEHTATITPSFDGINMRISGRDRNQVKEYLYQTYDYALGRCVEYEWNCFRLGDKAITYRTIWHADQSRVKAYKVAGREFATSIVVDSQLIYDYDAQDKARAYAVELMKQIPGINR